jgi:hypothetical protein
MNLSVKQDSPIILEFVGLPGAGKTTLAKHLIKYRENDQHQIRLFQLQPLIPNSQEKRTKQLVHVLRFGRFCLGQVPFLSLQLFCFGLQMGRPSMKRLQDLYRYLLMLQQVDQIRANGTARQIIILDQGFLQLQGSILLPNKEVKSSGLQNLIRLTMPNRIDGVVWVECPPGTSLNRVYNRQTGGNSRFKHWSPAVAEPRQLAMKQLTQKALHIAKKYGIPSLSISGTSLPDQNEPQISQWLTTLRETI